MREITDHAVDGVNDRLRIFATDDLGPGGAHHHYSIAVEWPADPMSPVGAWRTCSAVRFQNGPLSVSDVNGITHEVLLAIVADRLRCFQAGPYAHPANEVAYNAMQEALGALKSRTLERLQRGVEGTMQK